MHQLHKGRHANSITSLPCGARMLRSEGTNVQKLLKEELRMTIMAKRHARGQGHLHVDFPEPKPRELTLAELERRERRREQNRRAAQRCRRKKRLSQMSVIQNYEWIMGRNHQLEQELEQLRQEKNQVQSLLKAHCQACTCTHAPSLLPRVLDTAAAAVKVEPGDDPSPAQASFGPCDVSRESWQQYGSEEGMTTMAGGAACISQPAYSNQNVHAQSASFPSTTPFTATTSSPSCHNHLSSAPTCPNVSACPDGSRESSVPTPGSGTAGRLVYSNGRSLTTLVPAVPYSSSPCVQQQQQPVSQPVSSPAFSLLDDLAYLPGGLRACVFHEEAATPLSADGRRSISSVSSDVSAISEQPVGDVSGAAHDGLPGEELYGPDDVSTSDVSQLLSQINQSDLIFQPDGGNLDEVFSDSVGALNSLPEHFLQSL